MRAARGLLIPLMLAGCAPETEEIGELSLLSPREQLIRLSVDLRGIHPTEADLRAIEQDPELYADFADRWLEDPRFLDRIAEIFNFRYLTRTGDTYFSLDDAGLGQVHRGVMADIIADEPLALLRYVVANDLPYSTMVTADHTMANRLLARMWDIELADPDAQGWQIGRYRDGRPHAGMLSMTTLWQRYPSMGGNANRHRANAISKMFLCDDYLVRPIVLNRASVDQLVIDPENAIATNASCQSCHSTLDPLSANFFGFFNEDDDQGLEQTVYRPENEGAWRDHAGKPPGFFGRPIAHLQELGQELASDPRFTSCAVQTVFEGLTQREVTDDSWTELQHHIDVFEDSEQRIPAVVRSIVLSDTYRAGDFADPHVAERIPTLKTASPAQLASIVADITGYRWTFRGREGLTTLDRGLPVLVGGVDGSFVTVPSYLPSVGSAFTVERLAQAAGWHVASHDLAPERTADAILLHYVTVQDTPEGNPAAFEAQIRHLYLAVTGIPLPDDAPEPEELMRLWKYLYSVQASPTAAWAGVTSAVLRDPRVIFY